MKKYVLITCIILLGACSSVSIPVTGSTSDGEKWSGYFTMKAFTISGEDTVCEVETSKKWSKTNTATLNCDDGRSGTGLMTRIGLSGGTFDFKLTDGTIGNLTY